MKKLNKVLSIALAGVMFSSVASLPANAASVSKVKNLKVTSVDDDEINLKWSKVSGASGYQIQVKAPGGKWKTVESTKKVKEDIDELQDATVYQIRVRAYKNASSGKKYGAYSSVVKTTTDPDEVNDLKLKKISSKKVKLSWNAVPGADGYRLYKYNESKGDWERIAKLKGTSKEVSVSSKGGEKFRVRAYVLYNDKYYYGDASDSVKYVVSASSSAGQISKAKAKEIALKDAGVSKVYDYEIEKDRENGILVYEIDFKSGRYEYEYVIDASNGNILHEQKERDD